MSGAEKYLDKELELNHPLKKGDITLVSKQYITLHVNQCLSVCLFVCLFVCFLVYLLVCLSVFSVNYKRLG